ncbi:MAG: SGNH/GDSL hydrolase family protein, partial [Planctomycetaceae bacterium]
FVATSLLLGACIHPLPGAEPQTDGPSRQSTVSRPETDRLVLLESTGHDTDRLVLLGSTFIERAQRFGYLETAIIRRKPNNTISIRNLGWSGDTVFAESRGIFDPPAKGYSRMLDQIRTLKPTVIVLAYGMNESYAGQTGLPRFLKQLGRLIDDLQPTQAQIVLASPHWHTRSSAPLPDPTTRNRNLELYIQALATYAQERKLPFLNLRRALSATQRSAKLKLTDNGIHPNATGYWSCAELFADQLFGAVHANTAGTWRVEIDANGQIQKLVGTRLDQIQVAGGKVAFRARDAYLPAPRLGTTQPAARRLQVTGLPAGQYSLKVDGRVVARGSAAQWSKSRTLDNGPEFTQVERLRQTIIDKNMNYFHRWRPQNVTYLFGFRKHEQGQNAKEVAEFDGLVSQAESRISKLRQPQYHTYELASSQPERRIQP